MAVIGISSKNNYFINDIINLFWFWF